MFLKKLLKKGPIGVVVEVALAMGANGNNCHGYCGQGI